MKMILKQPLDSSRYGTKMIITIAFLFLIFGMNAQFTKIPDRNFEQALIDRKIDSDGVINQKVLTSDISGLRSLIIPHRKIVSLTGIEGFKSLIYLDISYNVGLNNLTLASNPLLEELICHDSSLDEIYISENLNLARLNCSRNNLKIIDIKNNLKLTHIYCSSNEIESLELIKNTLLEELNCSNNPLGSLNITDNEQLKLLYCYQNNLEILDVRNNLLLESLACQENKLTNLEINLNLKLKLLFFNRNKIANIDTNKNTLLERLECSENGLTELNLEKNIKLYSLYCHKNKLTSLDLGNNPLLRRIKIIDNDLNKLNLKSGGNEKIVFIRAKRNLLLTCVSVDNPSYFESRFRSGFASIVKFVETKEECGRVAIDFVRKKTFIPDANFERYLHSKNLDGTESENDQHVYTDLIEAEVSLLVHGQEIKDLTGIADFADLKYLYCQNNKIVNLDLSGNPLLKKASFYNNPLLESLNLKNVNKIENIYGLNNPKLKCVSVDHLDFFINAWRHKFDSMVLFVDNPDDCNRYRRRRRAVETEKISIAQIFGEKITVDVVGEHIKKVEIWNKRIGRRLRSFKKQEEYNVKGLRRKIIHVRVITSKGVLNKKVWLRRL